MNETLVTLRLDGDLERGFRVLLDIGSVGERPYGEWQGELPPQPELAAILHQWQRSYRELGTARIIPQEIIYGGSINRVENCRQLGDQLGDRFLQWLNTTSFRSLDLRLREELQRQDSIRILLRSSDQQVRHLPWSLWDLVERFPRSELLLSATHTEQPITRSSPPGSVNSPPPRSLPPSSPPSLSPSPPTTLRILAILGHSNGIDIETDRALLASLPNASVTFLVEPPRQQLTDQLWEQSWDLLFFAGHSQTSGDTGRIAINPQDSLTIAELTYGLKRAIGQGLQLAIFNSCDGLGLAKALEPLQLPQVIVMRQPVPDRVAQTFLRYFLSAFASGAPLHLATRQARERLQALENEFPHASWLPILCQTPTSLPLSLPPSPSPSPPPHSPAPLLPALLLTLLLLTLRSLGLLQPWELQAFDRLMRLRPAEPIDQRLLVVTIDEADIQYQDRQGMDRRGSLSDQALAQLLSKLSPHRPRLVGLDVFHDFEFSPALATPLPLIATCEVGAARPIAAPPGLGEDQLGFSDIPVDPDAVIRRQFLGMTSVAACPTSKSFSFQIAQRYLAQQGLPDWQRNPQGEVQIGAVSLPKLTPRTGGYQLPLDEAKGYQVLLNYRQAEPQRLSLRSLLQGDWDQQLGELVGDRIILIGVDNGKDAHFTPHSQRNLAARLPGVMVQAHMVSQIVSAVLQERPLLRGLPPWAEVLLLAASASLGSAIGWIGRRGTPGKSTARWGLMLGSAIAILYGMAYGLLLVGWWLPVVSLALALVTTSGAVMASPALPGSMTDWPFRSPFRRRS